MADFKKINGNASFILNMVITGELKNDDVVFSIVNNCTYKIIASDLYVRLEEIEAVSGQLKRFVADI